MHSRDLDGTEFEVQVFVVGGWFAECSVGIGFGLDFGFGCFVGTGCFADLFGIAVGFEVVDKLERLLFEELSV